jgi:hypothetical protein
MSDHRDIIQEYKVAVLAVKEADRPLVESYGMIAPVHRIGLVALAQVRRVGKSFIYEPDADGERAVILPAWDGPMTNALAFIDEPDRLFDLVARLPQSPDIVLTRRGLATALGEEAIRTAYIATTPLRLFRTPASWACAGGVAAGAFIIDWHADLGLLELKTIIAEDVDHGSDVQRRLKGLRTRMLRRMPRVRVPIGAAPS